MKRIFSMFFVMFVGLALMISGGVLLSGYSENDLGFSREENLDKVGTSATIPERHRFYMDSNRGKIDRPRSYQIGDIKLTNFGYGFSVNSNGYFESQNKGVNNSYSMLKIQFSANSAVSNSFSIRYISYAENDYDYAIFSNIDQTLSESYSVDSTYYKRTYGESSAQEKTVTYYNISNGTHFVYVKFRKDRSNHNYNDSLQLFFETDLLKNANAKYNFYGLMYGTLPTASRANYEFDGWWTQSEGGERITETSIYNNSNTIYAHWKPLTININSNGGIITNMSFWRKYYNGDRVSISYNNSTKMNAVTINGTGGWEIVGCPVEVERNTSYSFTFDYSVGDFATSDGQSGVYLQVVIDVPNGNLQQESLANVLIEKNTSGTKTVNFNSGDRTMVYLVFNGGYFADGNTYTINLGNFCRNFGNIFNMLAEVQVSNFSTLNNSIGSNSAEKNGYNVTGWTTSAYHNKGYSVYNASGNMTVLNNNNYLNNLNTWTKNSYPEAMSTSYDSSTQMSTLTVTGVGGWEILSTQVTVTPNTTYTLTFEFQANEFDTSNSEILNGIPLMVVHNVSGSTLQDSALMTSLIYSGSSGRRTVSFNSGSYSTLYFALNPGFLKDGTTYSIKIGNFYLTSNSIPQVSNSFWNNNGTYKYYSNITIYPQFSIKNYTVSLLSGDTGITSVSGSGTYNYGSSVSISASVKAGYSFLRWSDGNTSRTRTLSNLQQNYSLTAYSVPNTYTLTYNANGGTTPLSSTNIGFNDLYGKKNVYDPSKCIVSGPLSRSGSVFTLNCNNTSGGFQWGNFFQNFSGAFRPNTKYTVVYECLTFGGGDFGITFTSTDEEGGSENKDISGTGQTLIRITGVGVYTSSFVSKSDFNISGLKYDFRSYVAVENGKNVNATFRVSLFVGDVIYNNFSYATYGSMPTTNLLPTPTKAYHTFAGWWTSLEGGSQITASSAYTVAGNSTVYAHWTANTISTTVKLRLIDRNGSYTDVDNNAGGSVKVEGVTTNSGLSILANPQTSASASYTVHASQQFRLTANANWTANQKYVFVGFSTSSTPSEAMKNPTTKPNNIASYNPTGNMVYYVYFKQVSNNQLKYDETDKYFYFEDGYYPQSEATNASTLNSSATETGEKISITQAFPTDLREWTRYAYGERFSFSSFNSTTGMNTFTVNGVSGWEIIGYPVKVTQNTNYTLSFDYQQNGFDTLGGGYGGLPVMITNLAPSSDCLDRCLSQFLIYPSSSTEKKTATINFNSGTNTTVYIVINAGWLNDAQTHTVNIGNFKLSGGEYDASKEIPVYSYNGNRYAKVSARGETKWFKFEPIRWRISDYGVEKNERSISRYTTLLRFKNYGSSSSDFTAVSDLILGVGAMHSTREVDENRKDEQGRLDGTYSIHLNGFQNVENVTNGVDLNFSYNSSLSQIDVERYGYTETGDGNAVFNSADNGWYHPYDAPLRIVSIKELETVGFVNKQARASDMVAFILGQDKNNVSYWTRDLSNLGSGIAITPTGTQVRPWLDEVLGMRFAYNFREGSAGGGKLDFETLNYIQSTGTQWIDTGWATTTGMLCEFQAEWLTPGYLVGSHDAEEPYGRNGGWLSNEIQWQLAYGRDCPNLSPANLNQLYNVKFSTLAGDVYLDVDGIRIGSITGDEQQTAKSNVLIFNNSWGLAHGSACTQAKFYGAKIWSSEGMLVRDFVPVRNSHTGEIGLWDNVTDRFFANSGTGTFLAG